MFLLSTMAITMLSITKQSGVLQLDARAVPVAHVLEVIAREAHFDLKYVGSPPKTVISLATKGSPAEVTRAILETARLSYGMTDERAGIAMLVIVEPGTGAQVVENEPGVEHGAEPWEDGPLYESHPGRLLIPASARVPEASRFDDNPPSH